MDNSNATTSNGLPLFKINQNGEILAAIDLSGHSGYFVVTVMVKNPNTDIGTRQEIPIEVLDVNDETPMFVQPSEDNAYAYILEVKYTYDVITFFYINWYS